MKISFSTTSAAVQSKDTNKRRTYQKQVDDFQFNIVEMTAWLEGKLALKI